MKNSSRNIKIALLVLAFIVSPFVVQELMAQVSPVGPPPGVPIDGGITLLLAGLGAYGAKKIFEKKEEE